MLSLFVSERLCLTHTLCCCMVGKAGDGIQRESINFDAAMEMFSSCFLSHIAEKYYKWCNVIPWQIYILRKYMCISNFIEQTRSLLIFYRIRWSDVMWCDAIDFVSCHVMSCLASYYDTLTMPCHVISCHGMQCYVVWCFAISIMRHCDMTWRNDMKWYDMTYSLTELDTTLCGAVWHSTTSHRLEYLMWQSTT